MKTKYSNEINSILQTITSKHHIPLSNILRVRGELSGYKVQQLFSPTALISTKDVDKLCELCIMLNVPKKYIGVLKMGYTLHNMNTLQLRDMQVCDMSIEIVENKFREGQIECQI